MSLEHSPRSPEIAPFWLRLPLFFRYPLHWEPLLYMGFLSLATLLGFVLPLGHFLAHFLVWLAYVRYAYKTLDQTAQGLLTPDEHVPYDDPTRNSLPYKQFAVFVVIALVLALAQSVGGLLFGVALIYCLLAIPASVMILSITRSLLQAINPGAAIGMMRVIGLPYLGLCAFLFLLSASQDVMMSVLLPRVPDWLLLPAANFVAMYFMLIMFNMMGYVIYQHHHLLGVRLSPRATGAVGKEAESEQQTDVIGRLIADGEIDKAVDLAYEAQRTAPDDVGAHTRYHKLLALAGKDERLMRHAQPYLALLLEKGKGDEALALFHFLRERDTAFAPEQPALLLRLAEAARQRREYKEALALLRGFDKRFPRHAEIPSVYLFAAQVLCENLRQDAQAKQILTVLLERYPEHSVRPQAQQLLKVLDNLALVPPAR